MCLGNVVDPGNVDVVQISPLSKMLPQFGHMTPLPGLTTLFWATSFGVTAFGTVPKRCLNNHIHHILEG